MKFSPRRALLISLVMFLSLGCSRREKGPTNVYVGPEPAPGFGISCFASEGQTDWIKNDPDGFTTCSYPDRQQWGGVYLFANADKTYDFSEFNYLEIDLKGEDGGEEVYIGVKTESESDDPSQPSYVAINLTKQWQTFKIPLSELVRDPDFPASRFRHLHDPCRLFFSGDHRVTIHFRHVKYTK